MIEILDEQIVFSQGSFRRVRRWLKGAHPHLGAIIWGHTGIETYQETEVVQVMVRFSIEEPAPNRNSDH